MIVPEYWAEAKTKVLVKGRQITIKRFGWSDNNESEAENNARKRVADAVERVESGKNITAQERKVPYNGADGLPIREEIIQRHHDLVITRNSYGALCINTPDVLFADIDFQNEPGGFLFIISFLLLASASAILGLEFNSWNIFSFSLLIALFLTSVVAYGLFKLTLKLKGGPENKARNAIVTFSKKHPDWHLRIYRTPMGFRVLVLHKTFSSKDEDALLFLKAVNSDPLYVQMCKNQHCFRARVSPKPWRIGVDRLKPRPGIWPVKEEKLAARVKWVAHYEKVAQNYASCQFVEKLGSSVIDRKAEAVQLIHDKYSKSDRTLKIA